MGNFFPRHTLTWKFEEPPAFRKLALSVWEVALITGVVLRLLRALVLTHGSGASWLYLGGAFALGAAIFFAMVTLHLGNFTVRTWVWRAPVFGMLEGAAESVVSLLLIALHREPLGTGRAELRDWWSIAGSVLLSRIVVVSLFALLLAGVVQWVRRATLKREHHEALARGRGEAPVAERRRRP